MPKLSDAQAATFLEIVAGCLHREFPNHILHLMQGPEDVGTPRELTPAFFGCFDWHSAVHSHWTLVRLARCFPDAPVARRAVQLVEQSLTPEHMAGELRYLSGAGREGFERPYGLSWLLQLAAECREATTTWAGCWQELLEPLERLARDRLAHWLSRLTHPVRSGEHSQTAFAMGLAWDWAELTGDEAFAALLAERAGTFYGQDTGYRLAFEPSGQDFFSPALSEADLLRRILPADAFAEWLEQFLPDIRGAIDTRRAFALQPVTVSDAADGKLAHLDGLNLSRAWMLHGIAAGLPTEDVRVPFLRESAEEHARRGLQSVTGQFYAGAHWLPTFAVYLLTARGTTRGQAPVFAQ